MIDKDLQVFIPNTEIIEESVKQFVEMYSLRTRKSREYWLVDARIKDLPAQAPLRSIAHLANITIRF